jgi:glycosyltransferase involved in cell wall biosynthesis
MKILQVHNYYRNRGGEDLVLEMEKLMLEKYGHEVIQFVAHNNEINSFSKKIKMLFNFRRSKKFDNLLFNKLTKELPDIVHFHNIYPLLTPSIFSVCKKLNIPIVQTLHNFRMMCINGLFYRNGSICEDCSYKTPYSGLFHKCYRDSYLASFSMTDSLRYHNRKNTWNNDVDAFIVLTEFAKEKFEHYGVSNKKLFVKPNFMPDNETLRISGNKNDYVLYVGRLSKEKGILWLLEAWKSIDVPLIIAGDGPLSSEVVNSNNPNIKYVGLLERNQLSDLYSDASMLVMASEWYEGFPMVIIESLSHGVPVIVPDIGGLGDVINDSINGYVYRSKDIDHFKNRVLSIFFDVQAQNRLSKNSEKSYKDSFSDAINIKTLLDIYRKVIKNNANNFKD